MAQTKTKRAKKKKAPPRKKLISQRGVEHEEKDYVFRFKDGAEFGLGGVVGYTKEDGDYVWYDKDGDCLLSPRESVIFFCPKPDPPKPINNPTDDIDKHVKETHPPDVVKDKITEASHTEAQRYLVRNRDGQRCIVDTDNPTFDLDIHEKDAGPFGELVMRANRDVETEKANGYQDSIQEEGVMRITILDIDKKPVMSMSGEMFKRAVTDNEFAFMQLPVVQKPNGDTYRFEENKDGERFLRRCEMKIVGAVVGNND